MDDTMFSALVGGGVLLLILFVAIIVCTRNSDKVLVPLSFNPNATKDRPTKEIVDRVIRKSYQSNGEYIGKGSNSSKQLELSSPSTGSSVALAVPYTGNAANGLVLHGGRLLDAGAVSTNDYEQGKKLGTGAGPPPPLFTDPSPASNNSLTGHALYDFSAGTAAELNLTAGERVVVLQSGSDGWMQARNMKGKVGLVPSSYVEVPESVRSNRTIDSARSNRTIDSARSNRTIDSVSESSTESQSLEVKTGGVTVEISNTIEESKQNPDHSATLKPEKSNDTVSDDLEVVEDDSEKDVDV